MLALPPESQFLDKANDNDDDNMNTSAGEDGNFDDTTAVDTDAHFVPRSNHTTFLEKIGARTTS